MASEAGKHSFEGNNGGEISRSGLAGLGRTAKLLAIMAVVASCESAGAVGGQADAVSGDVHGEISSVLKEASILDQIQFTGDHKGVEIFGKIKNTTEPLKIHLKLLGANGETLETSDQQVGPGPFKVIWNFSKEGGHTVEMTDKNGKGASYDLDAGSDSIPNMPTQNP